MKLGTALLLLFLAIFFLEIPKSESAKRTKQKADSLSLEIFKYQPNEELGYCFKSIFKIKQNNQYLDSIIAEVDYSECDTDCQIDYFNNSIKINDLNNDNYNEISFVYRIRCVSDVSPYSLYGVLYDTRTKSWHTIYGMTTYNLLKELYNATEGSIIEISKDFPELFLSYLKKEWYAYSFSEKISQDKARNKASIIYLKENTNNSKKTSIKNISKVKFSSPNVELTLSDNSVFKFNEPVFFVDDVQLWFHNKTINLTDVNELTGKRRKSLWYFDENKETLFLRKIIEHEKGKYCALDEINSNIKLLNINEILELLGKNCR